MDDLVIARSLFGMTMGVHIIFATLGVGLPVMILISELLFQKTKHPDYALMADRWTRGFAVILGVGIPTGTIAGVQLALLWPGFMEVVGKVISLPFQIEVFAFFLEALFMSIYVYAADRLSPWLRILSLFFVCIGALASAVLITNVHAFEGTPAGFTIANGEILAVDPWKAFFNPSFAVTAVHVALTAIMTGAFFIAMIASYKLLKKSPKERTKQFHRKALRMAVITGGVFALLTSLNGHESAQHLHHYQPEKLAAAEGLFDTTTYAPLTIGGFTDRETQEVKFGIEIPWALSFLANNSFDEEVLGLNDFPEEWWPPLFSHTLFNTMVFAGGFLLFWALLAAFYLFIRKKQLPRWMLVGFVASGPIALIGIETGWIFACSGRQPWVIYRMMKTSEAVTTSSGLPTMFVAFLCIYIVLVVTVIIVLHHYFKRNPLEPLLIKEERTHE
ncbi:cytochrome ubiquinol oxidase subunit I [Aureibacillus halotolerans]|uniref:Cytochrome bd-I ubiquinol oxidase subunit 1 apoprotein n=1 Tax=Aureibacillus halotolerans TaxID=1508390 RepID=A0A4R6U8D2_9BACI|nr:cytochrome ubiquinol oxidase subunit I [Aureibacillus halotolerans]TDQ42056.1 cytochrome bd-I ubiquinol oxidase subunit 1 apoprotein [Aureibacillus halotolerans]